MERSELRVTIRRCFRNSTSLVGGGIAGLAFATNLFLLLVDFFAPHQNPYVGILTYMLLPVVTVSGLVLALAGALLQYNRLQRGLQIVELPRLDLNIPRHRVALGVSFLLVIGFLGLSGVGGYHAYKFTDSVEFCGEVCHTVMMPVFSAYQGSPHARVDCVACHIGPGAEWFVRAKLSGVYQVYSVLFDKFPRPIPTPIHNLRPAQDTCEQCHWPAKFWGERLATRIHFASDEQNTRREIRLLMKIGGGPQKGLTEGIHWHMNIANRIWYIATDDRRLTIPWVRMEDPQGRITEFVSTDHPVTPGEVEQGEIRLMDCMDCHNRPSHHYLSPAVAVDLALLAGQIPADLPSIKKVSVEAMVQPYATTAEAERGIERHIREFYQTQYPQVIKRNDTRVQTATAEVIRAYRNNFFPEMRMSWQAYPDHIGHKEFPGCFRCHDGKHVSGDGRVIRRECGICHDFLEQRRGALVRVPATPAFGHPWNLGGRHAEIACADCHTGGPAKPATCRGCHGIAASGSPMAAMECKTCHLKEQVRLPLAGCPACHPAPAGLHAVEMHAAAGCVACHTPHTWSPDPRQQCLTCHADMAEHNPGPPCAECHSFRHASAAGGRGQTHANVHHARKVGG
jgi:Cytochrome c3/NapC/NirT cytochrome c family, N-terminal region